MSLFSLTEKLLPEFFLIAILNSTFISLYAHYFVNNTQTFQINDARQVPIIVPTAKQLGIFKSIFDDAVSIKNNNLMAKFLTPKQKNMLEKIQARLDREVYQLYGFSREEIALLP